MIQDFAVSRAFRWVRSARSLVLGLAISASAGAAASASTCGQGIGAGMEPGRHDFSILSNGEKRDGVYFVPSAYDGKKPLPVVFDFHGSNSNPHGQLNRSGWDKLAERDGLVVVALAGSLTGEMPGTHAWNVPGVTTRPGGLDEVRFIHDAIAMVKGKFCVDEERFYGSGYSGGGRMLSQFICTGSADFNAAGFVASLRAGYPLQTEGKWGPDAASCTPARPMSIIAFAGLKDPANPYQGGGKSYWQYGGETALKRWAEMDGCKGAAKSKVGESFTVNSYDVCKAGARIQSYVINDWDHAWPRATMKAEVLAASAVVTRKPGGEQTPKAEPAVERKMPTGEVTRTVDAAERMWDFFRNTEGQLVVDAVVKKDCGAKATSASATVSEAACTSNSKPSALPVAKTLNLSGSSAPVAEDAL